MAEQGCVEDLFWGGRGGVHDTYYLVHGLTNCGGNSLNLGVGNPSASPPLYTTLLSNGPSVQK